ncbi:hypothetical protein ASPSYDRAFT_31953 [Aspergillus sydowii CBS 593.65]|uniref:Uncharacterized protein n=1 Tax=Aspergillus sydowii CBS 593.65 TaxID=1036612 RepID=A0A1L9TEK7_9EURO|nr:uncharacterized protein ASPSYDRAFT_31953 [Aspergillus sydowii CBS 593.65]OJJ57862.1 hypothetical protein ASPSYDRAFT_31953 [Aspergillus sydowii CBS 593.65]
MPPEQNRSSSRLTFRDNDEGTIYINRPRCSCAAGFWNKSPRHKGGRLMSPFCYGTWLMLATWLIKPQRVKRLIAPFVPRSMLADHTLIFAATTANTAPLGHDCIRRSGKAGKDFCAAHWQVARRPELLLGTKGVYRFRCGTAFVHEIGVSGGYKHEVLHFDKEASGAVGSFYICDWILSPHGFLLTFDTRDQRSHKAIWSSKSYSNARHSPHSVDCCKVAHSGTADKQLFGLCNS